MGWIFDETWTTKKDITHHLDGRFNNNKATLIQSSTVGNNHWQLVDASPEQGDKLIVLNLLSKNKHHGWGYKTIDETSSPFEVNCPLSMLNRAGQASDPIAKQWREAAYAFHEKIKQVREFKNTLQANDVLEYGGKTHILTENLGRQGWLINGGALRMSNRQINDSIENYFDNAWSDEAYLAFDRAKQAHEICEGFQPGDRITYHFPLLEQSHEFVLQSKNEDLSWIATNAYDEDVRLPSAMIHKAVCQQLKREQESTQKQAERLRSMRGG